MSSFTKKKLTAVISLGKGQFGQDGANTLTLKDLRISASIDKAGGISQGTAQIRVWGLRQVDMNQLTMLSFHPLQFADNKIQILAGEDGGSMSSVYQGSILSAWGDYQSSPDVPLEIGAMSGYFNQLKPVEPNSFKGTTDVATIMQMLASKMGYTFENNGVQINLASPYLAGSAMDQARAVQQAANIEMGIDENILYIAPKGMGRKGQIPLINKDTGLRGYPAFDTMGISFETLFNPGILFGGMIKIQSEIATANGQFRVVSVGHLLESEKPGGAWFTRVWCTDVQVPVVNR